MGDLADRPRRISLDGDRWRCRAFLGDEWQSARLGQPHEPGREGWLPASVPGSVAADLLRAGEIPDPYLDRNTRFAEWAAERWWAYETEFEAPAPPPEERVQLVLEGLDYAGRVYLDGEPLGEHEGMFVPAVFEVGDALRRRPGRHVLTVLLAPAPREESQTGDTARVRTHKSRMTYGWDFCPRLPHQGIWQPVSLRHTGPWRMERPFVRAQPEPGGRSARLACETDIDAAESARVSARLEVVLEGSTAAATSSDVDLRPGRQRLELEVELDQPALWWPNGYGEQVLYNVVLSLELDGRRSDACVLRSGVRSLRLEPNAGAPPAARPYRLVVNELPVYVNGWNWVPLDLLYGVPQPAKLEHLLGLARAANVNLLRVWGGGLIESEHFYSICDRLGILVWQEFIQSSSGERNAPSEDPPFVEMMVEQAEEIVPRRRNHPSLAFWCGGNELMRDGRPLDESAPVLRALREVVGRLDPDRPFLPTSPFGPVTSFADMPAGGIGHDVHGPWEHQGLNRQQELYNGRAALLHSEFGVEGMANEATIEATISAGRRWPPTRDNRVYAHRGAWWINEPLVQAAFGRGIDDLPTLVRASQLLHADGLRYAVESSLRGRWLSSGTLPWQFNEPFPNAWCTSAVDYFGRPKPAYHAVAAAYEQLHLSAAFERQVWAGERLFSATLWVSSSRREEVTGLLVARCLAADGSESGRIETEVLCPALAAASLGELAVPLAAISTDIFVLDLTLHAARGQTLAQSRYLFSRRHDLAPLRELARAEVQLSREEPSDGRWRVCLSNPTASLAPSLRLEDARPAGAPGWAYPLRDQLTLLPGEAQEVEVVFDGVPSSQRRLRLSGWNIEERLID